jgi:hypothetical protein
MSSQANIRTLNQLVNNFREIASLHQMIRRFEYGNPTAYYQSGTTDAPELWMHVDTVSRHVGGTATFEAKLTMADEIKRDGSDELEVESDLIQIATDVLDQCYISAASYGWVVKRDEAMQIQVFTEDRKTPKNLKLVQFQINIQLKVPINGCAIPFSQNPI